VEALSDADEVNHDGTGLALHIGNGHGIAITGAELMQQGNWIVVIAKAHGLTGRKRIECTKDGGVTETLGHTTGIKGVDGLRGHMTGGARTHGLSPKKFKDSLSMNQFDFKPCVLPKTCR
jgi:hypothetical protein